jgi:hypothetical protein
VAIFVCEFEFLEFVDFPLVFLLDFGIFWRVFEFFELCGFFN